MTKLLIKIFIALVACVFIVSGDTKAPIFSLEYLDPKTGQQGYDLFFYDGLSLRDEKWRFDPLTGVPVVNSRHGYRQNENDRFNVFDTQNNGDGYSYSGTIVESKNIADYIKNRVEEPPLIPTGATLKKVEFIPLRKFLK